LYYNCCAVKLKFSSLQSYDDNYFLSNNKQYVPKIPAGKGIQDGE
ncbi:hypothetical protein T01_3354, partial [Trichinella spiralis]